MRRVPGKCAAECPVWVPCRRLGSEHQVFDMQVKSRYRWQHCPQTSQTDRKAGTSLEADVHEGSCKNSFETPGSGGLRREARNIDVSFVRFFIQFILHLRAGLFTVAAAGAPALAAPAAVAACFSAGGQQRPVLGLLRLLRLAVLTFRRQVRLQGFLYRFVGAWFVVRGIIIRRVQGFQCERGHAAMCVILEP